MPDQRANIVLLEHPGHRITARTGHFVDDHHLGAKDCRCRLKRRFAFAGCVDHLRRPLHFIDYVVGDIAAVVEAFVKHRALLPDLGIIVSIEIREPARSRVRQIDIGKPAA